MYPLDPTDSLRARLRRVTDGAWRRVAPNVWFLGVTSLLTDVSSEMVVSVLPLYLVLNLGLSPFAFGVIDGLYPGVTALVRWGGGILGDRTQRHKELAAIGYSLSAVTRLLWLVARANPTMLGAVVALDRVGKGLRTAPRDALISLSSARASLAGAFGVHRALDAAGAMLGPLVAFTLLATLPSRFDVVFVASFCVAIVGLAVLLLFVENVPATTVPTSSRNIRREAASLLSNRQLRTTIVASSALALTTVSDGFVYLALQEQGRIQPAYLPLMYVGTSCSFLVLAAPFGFLADRLRPWKVFLLGHMLLVLLYPVMLLPSLPTIGVVLALMLLGGYYAATDGVLAALASAVLPAPVRGTGLGLVATMTNVARLLGSIVFGWIWTAGDRSIAVLAFAVALPVAMLVCGRALALAESRSSAADEHGI